jgi:hypothetical protein
MLSPNKPIAANPLVPRYRTPGISGPQIAVLFVALTLLISIPIWTHPLPPLSDYVNHLARMHVIATLPTNPLLANFYELNWQVIPNLTMDLIVPVLARFVNVYLAGQIYIVTMFALIISGTLALNRALIGRWSVLPLFAFPLLYNYVFLVGLMNYIFGIGVALWALAGWVAVRERAWPIRLGLSRCFSATFRHLAFMASACCHSKFSGFGNCGWCGRGQSCSSISLSAACRFWPRRRCFTPARRCS